jgi:hypothetical protein
MEKGKDGYRQQNSYIHLQLIKIEAQLGDEFNHVYMRCE